MVEGAIMVALATVLSFIKVFKLPWGGSITLLSMLPIVIYSIRHGLRSGFAAAFVYALIQFGQGVIIDGLFAWGLSAGALVLCIFLDYIAAFTVLGIAGIFRSKGIPGWIAGISLAVVLRFIVHFISGIVLGGDKAELWGGFVPKTEVAYSFFYNGAYMLPELIFTVIGAVVLFSVPQTKKIIANND